MSRTEPPVVESLALPSPTRRRRLILGIATFTALTEVLYVAGLVPGVRIGTLDLSLGIIPALGLAVACGSRLLGRSTRRGTAIVFWGAAVVGLAGLLVVFTRQHRPGLWLSLVVAAFGEELIYRLAVPMVVAAVLRMVGVRARWARPAGYVVAALWFVSLPGHVSQMDGPAQALPFLAFAALAALVVYRSGSVLPMAAVHAVTNLSTVLLWADATSADQRSLGLVLGLGLLVLAYGERRRLTIGDDGELVDTETGLDVATIDLRDGHPVTVTLTDGTVLPVGPAHLDTRRVPTRELSGGAEYGPATTVRA